MTFRLSDHGLATWTWTMGYTVKKNRRYIDANILFTKFTFKHFKVLPKKWFWLLVTDLIFIDSGWLKDSVVLCTECLVFSKIFFNNFFQSADLYGHKRLDGQWKTKISAICFAIFLLKYYYVAFSQYFQKKFRIPKKIPEFFSVYTAHGLRCDNINHHHIYLNWSKVSVNSLVEVDEKVFFLTTVSSLNKVQQQTRNKIPQHNDRIRFVAQQTGNMD